MQTFLEIDQFAKLVHLPRDIIDEMIKKGSLKHSIIDGVVYVEANSGTMALLPSFKPKNAEIDFSNTPAGNFIDKTISTFLNLHEKVLDAKDETLDALRTENNFLKEALISLQELYEADRQVISTTTKELEAARDEIEYLKRKYKLMWNKAVENYQPSNQ